MVNYMCGVPNTEQSNMDMLQDGVVVAKVARVELSNLPAGSRWNQNDIYKYIMCVGHEAVTASVDTILEQVRALYDEFEREKSQDTKRTDEQYIALLSRYNERICPLVDRGSEMIKCVHDIKHTITGRVIDIHCSKCGLIIPPIDVDTDPCEVPVPRRYRNI